MRHKTMMSQGNAQQQSALLSALGLGPQAPPGLPIGPPAGVGAGGAMPPAAGESEEAELAEVLPILVALLSQGGAGPAGGPAEAPPPGVQSPLGLKPAGMGMMQPGMMPPGMMPPGGAVPPQGGGRY